MKSRSAKLDSLLTPKQLAECEKLAEIPQDVLDRLVAEICDRDEFGELTTDEILRLWAEMDKPKNPQEKIPNLDSLRQQIANRGYDLQLTDQSIINICELGFKGNRDLALVACDILVEEKPTTLRGLMYQLVSAGWLPSTDQKHYTRTMRLMTRLREARLVPFQWIVDNVRSTLKPPSWSGLADWADAQRDLYRLDFWGRMPAYVHIIVEKDAIAGTLYPVTHEFDVRLSPLRGYCSLSFANEIAELWNEIDKPIFAYYLGDFDPSGFDLERDIREKLERYCTHSFNWKRLAVHGDHFEEYNLIPLDVKKSDKRAKAFIERYGHACAELDAIPSSELRRIVREAIEQHIPTDEWERLKRVEEIERENFNQFLDKLTINAPPMTEG